MAGTNFTVLSFRDRSCDVAPYTDEYDPNKGIPVVRAETSYTSACRRNYILVLNEALWMPELHHFLINPNQLRYSGVKVQDHTYSVEPMKITKSDN